MKKNLLKKIGAVLLAIVFVFTFAACSVFGGKSMGKKEVRAAAREDSDQLEDICKKAKAELTDTGETIGRYSIYSELFDDKVDVTILRDRDSFIAFFEYDDIYYTIDTLTNAAETGMLRAAGTNEEPKLKEPSSKQVMAYAMSDCANLRSYTAEAMMDLLVNGEIRTYSMFSQILNKTVELEYQYDDDGDFLMYFTDGGLYYTVQSLAVAAESGNLKDASTSDTLKNAAESEALKDAGADEEPKLKELSSKQVMAYAMSDCANLRACTAEALTDLLVNGEILTYSMFSQILNKTVDLECQYDDDGDFLMYFTDGGLYYTVQSLAVAAESGNLTDASTSELK